MRALGRSSDLWAIPPLWNGPTGRRFPAQLSQCVVDGFRSHSPLRGSPGLAPDSLVSRRVCTAGDADSMAILCRPREECQACAVTLPALSACATSDIRTDAQGRAEREVGVNPTRSRRCDRGLTPPMPLSTRMGRRGDRADPGARRPIRARVTDAVPVERDGHVDVQGGLRRP
jgi:hypothetical protein